MPRIWKTTSFFSATAVLEKYVTCLRGLAAYVTWNPVSDLLESLWNFTHAVGPVVAKGCGVVVLQ